MVNPVQSPLTAEKPTAETTVVPPTAEAAATPANPAPKATSRKMPLEEAQRLAWIDVDDAALRAAKEFVPLPVSMDLGYNKETRQLLEEVGGVAGLTRMTTIFYGKFFNDQHLRPFLGAMHTPLETHGRRIALYIAEMMGAPGQPWNKDLQCRARTPVPLAKGRSVVVDSRSSAHTAAWNSVEREPAKVGRRFKLDDCRVWMRLMFWAARESGLAGHVAFFSYFRRFIGHFIAIYETTAQVFTRQEARWSLSEANRVRYEKEWGRFMKDVVDVPYSQCLPQLPADERSDHQWPYE